MALSFFLPNCKKSPVDQSLVDQEDESKPKVRIEATTTAVETFTGAEVSGQVTYVYSGNRTTVNTGEKAVIVEIEQGQTAKVEIIVEADNHVKRIIKEEPMTGTHEYTINIVDKSNLAYEHGDYEKFVTTLAGGGYLTRLKPPSDGKLTVYFNPDRRGTGKRLPLDWIIETERVFDGIKGRSKGKITEVEYIRDGNKDFQKDDVGQGDIFVFEDTQNTGVSNITKENSDGSIYGIYLFFNSGLASKAQIDDETLDGVLAASEQNFLGNRPASWIEFAYSRNTGDVNGARMYTTHEEQNTIDEYCGIATYLGQLIITKPSNLNPSAWFKPPIIGNSYEKNIKIFYPAKSTPKRKRQ